MRCTMMIVWMALHLLSASACLGASWWERLGLGPAKSTNSSAATPLASLSQEQMVQGLKEALSQGVQHAITNLGQTDGFLKDPNVKIPMPDGLKKIERTLRTLGQEKMAEEFVATLNRAGEKAVPAAASVLGRAVQQMTVADARAILTGTNNAATQYFRRTSETNLYEKFLPLVKQATEEVGVTRAYKQMTDKVGAGGGFGLSLLSKDTADLDGYVTRKALDGLFFKIAAEEKRIRENPVARTTDLLQKVFGAAAK